MTEEQITGLLIGLVAFCQRDGILPTDSSLYGRLAEIAEDGGAYISADDVEALIG